jgi:hypothetical protein
MVWHVNSLVCDAIEPVAVDFDPRTPLLGFSADSDESLRSATVSLYFTEGIEAVTIRLAEVPLTAVVQSICFAITQIRMTDPEEGFYPFLLSSVPSYPTPGTALLRLQGPDFSTVPLIQTLVVRTESLAPIPFRILSGAFA